MRKLTPIPEAYFLRISNNKGLIKDLVFKMEDKSKLPLINNITIDSNEVRERIKKVIRKEKKYKESFIPDSTIKIKLISPKNTIGKEVYFLFKVKKFFKYILELEYMGIEEEIEISI